jgi:hypothetical protein
MLRNRKLKWKFRSRRKSWLGSEGKNMRKMTIAAAIAGLFCVSAVARFNPNDFPLRLRVLKSSVEESRSVLAGKQARCEMSLENVTSGEVYHVLHALGIHGTPGKAYGVCRVWPNGSILQGRISEHKGRTFVEVWHKAGRIASVDDYEILSSPMP